MVACGLPVPSTCSIPHRAPMCLCRWGWGREARQQACGADLSLSLRLLLTAWQRKTCREASPACWVLRADAGGGCRGTGGGVEVTEAEKLLLEEVLPMDRAQGPLQ